MTENENIDKQQLGILIKEQGRNRNHRRGDGALSGILTSHDAKNGTHSDLKLINIMSSVRCLSPAQQTVLRQNLSPQQKSYEVSRLNSGSKQRYLTLIEETRFNNISNQNQGKRTASQIANSNTAGEPAGFLPLTNYKKVFVQSSENIGSDNIKQEGDFLNLPHPKNQISNMFAHSKNIQNQNAIVGGNFAFQNGAYKTHHEKIFGKHNMGSLKSDSKATLAQALKTSWMGMKTGDKKRMREDMMDANESYIKAGSALILGQFSEQHFSLKKENIRALAQQLQLYQPSMEAQTPTIDTGLRVQPQQQHQRDFSVNLYSKTPQLCLAGASKPKQQSIGNKQNLPSATMGSSIYKTASSVSVNKEHRNHEQDAQNLPNRFTESKSRKENRRDIVGVLKSNPVKSKVTRMRDQLQLLKMHQLKQQSGQGKMQSSSFKNQLTQSPYYIPQLHDSHLEMLNRQQTRMKNYLGQLQNELQDRYFSNQEAIFGKSNLKTSTSTPVTQQALMKPLQKQYKFQIMSGNNSQLVRRVITQSTRRHYWQEIPNQTASNFHFRWAPVSKQVNFDRLSYNSFSQFVNHFEGHSEISRKHELFKNLRLCCDDYKENAFYITPLTFYLKISTDKTPFSIKQQLSQFKQMFNLLEEFKLTFDSDVSEVENTDLRNEAHPKLQSLVESGNVSFISKNKFPKCQQAQRRTLPIEES